VGVWKTNSFYDINDSTFLFFIFLLCYQWLNMLTRLVGRPVSAIWRVKLSKKWMNRRFGRRVVMPLLTPYILSDTHNAATVTGCVSRAQSTVVAKVSTESLQNITLKQQEIIMINKGLIFTNLRADYVDYRLAVVYARLKIGHIERALKLYESLTKYYPDEKERLTNVNIYNAFIEAYMKGDGRSKRHALYWFDKMRKHQVKPNLTTYAVLIKGFIQAGPIDAAHILLMEMLKEGYNISAFMVNRNISNDDLKLLNLICKTKEGDYFGISSAQINKLLSSMGKPTTELVEAPIDLSSVFEARPTNVLDMRPLEASLIPVEAKNMQLYERQLHFEEQAVSTSLERLRAVAKAQDTEASSNSYSLQMLMWSWHQKLYPIIVEEQQHARNPVMRADIYNYGSFLLLLDAEKLSMLTIQRLLRLSMDRDVENDISATYAIREIGNIIEMEYYIEQLRKRKNDLVKTRRLNLQALYSSGQLFDMYTREMQAKLLEEEEENDWLTRWPKLIRIKLGALLISMLLRVAKIKTTYYDKETGKHM
jgi:DNA-directed RNA polymerase